MDKDDFKIQTPKIIIIIFQKSFDIATEILVWV